MARSSRSSTLVQAGVVGVRWATQTALSRTTTGVASAPAADPSSSGWLHWGFPSTVWASTVVLPPAASSTLVVNIRFAETTGSEKCSKRESLPPTRCSVPTVSAVSTVSSGLKWVLSDPPPICNQHPDVATISSAAAAHRPPRATLITPLPQLYNLVQAPRSHTSQGSQTSPR